MWTPQFAIVSLVFGLIRFVSSRPSLRRAHKADDFEFSAVPFRGRWGWRKRARLLGYMGRIDYEDVD